MCCGGGWYRGWGVGWSGVRVCWGGGGGVRVRCAGGVKEVRCSVEWLVVMKIRAESEDDNDPFLASTTFGACRREAFRIL